ncbi:dienelactone hydrolase family protein [Rhabdothermincola sediminis]|uniref:dienelactone hydrolase family protein n=1 Tax=Rhabdothermincola sediminis TaxID=2751370 RepID=UPI001AA04022|nr:dienelactone hydrolase family protein [Rhabdothermincola sediminis]
MGELIDFPSNGHTCSGYLAVPASGSGPGVIVIQEWWGLVPHITDVCGRFAAEGFVALAPDLYHGRQTTEPDEAGKLMMALNLEQAGRDLSGAIDHLRSLEAVTSDGVGVIGFCMGGGLAMLVGTMRPDAVVAIAPFYGVIPWEAVEPDWSKLTAKVRGHFAAEDGFFPPDKVKALEEQLIELGKDVELVVHPGVDHAFFNDTRPEVYHPETAAEAWRATISFFRETIR